MGNRDHEDLKHRVEELERRLDTLFQALHAETALNISYKRLAAQQQDFDEATERLIGKEGQVTDG